MTRRVAKKPSLVLTVGHSNRSLADFEELLTAHGVTLLVDVRKLPGSRRYPHFNQDVLAAALRDVGIDYFHEPRLGGRRPAMKNSPNTGWKNRSFQGYADYMQTPEFAEALEELLERIGDRRAALMCAEAVPWQCHRSLIADALLVRSIEVADIMTPTKAVPHKLRDFAHVEGTRLTYPPPAEEKTLF